MLRRDGGTKPSDRPIKQREAEMPLCSFLLRYIRLCQEFRRAKKQPQLDLGTCSNFAAERVPSGRTRLTSDYNLFYIYQKARYKYRSQNETNVHKTKLSFKNSCIDTVSPDMLSLLLFNNHPIHENTLSAWVLVPGTHRYFLASLTSVGYSSFFARHQSNEFFSVSTGSFRYLLQQLSISFANVKISKPGELVHPVLFITLIVRHVDV